MICSGSFIVPTTRVPEDDVRTCPDGKRIVSGSHDKTLKVWDISSLD